MNLIRFVSVALLATLAVASPHATHAAEGNIRLPDYTSTTLDNGATLLLVPNKDVPLVAASVRVRGGSLADANGKEGTASLLSDMLS